MNLTRKPNAFFLSATMTIVIALLAIEIARSGYHFGRFLAGF